MGLFRRFFILFVVSFLVACSSDSGTDVSPSAENLVLKPPVIDSRSCTAPSLARAYRYFNDVRQQTGLIAVTVSDALQGAAGSHAGYLKLNQQAGHAEVQTGVGFSGVDAAARALRFGYRSTNVNEGVVGQGSTVVASIDGLMTAIYHRFAILDFYRDEVGIGFTAQENNCLYSFVHNGGSSGLNNVCLNSTFVSGGYYYAVCADENLKIATADYQAALDGVASQNPRYVLWPMDQATDVYPAFWGNEVPNPLPDYQQAGNPLSIQFNPYYVSEQVKLISFRLFDDQGEVTNTRLISQATDVNGKFSVYEYALFPLALLQERADYVAEVVFEDRGVQESVQWRFRTLPL
ncbi:MAG: CAP domain-containing protein [Gammaproteobacteria bacterium]|nr:CAP domain-containing protein [Gammaproteobacteria bacterium]